MDEDEDEEQVWKLPQLHESMEHLDGWRVEGAGWRVIMQMYGDIYVHEKYI